MQDLTRCVVVIELHHHIQLDGKQVAHAVSNHLYKQGQGTANTGNGFDASRLAYGYGMIGGH